MGKEITKKCAARAKLLFCSLNLLFFFPFSFHSRRWIDWEIWTKILKSWFRIWNWTRNPKTDFKAEISVFGFPFYRSIGKYEKGFEKLSLRTAVFTLTHNSAKRRPLFMRIVFESFFGLPNRTLKAKSVKSGFGFRNWNPSRGRISPRIEVKSIFGFRV